MAIFKKGNTKTEREAQWEQTVDIWNGIRADILSQPPTKRAEGSLEFLKTIKRAFNEIPTKEEETKWVNDMRDFFLDNPQRYTPNYDYAKQYFATIPSINILGLRVLELIAITIHRDTVDSRYIYKKLPSVEEKAITENPQYKEIFGEEEIRLEEVIPGL